MKSDTLSIQMKSDALSTITNCDAPSIKDRSIDDRINHLGLSIGTILRFTFRRFGRRLSAISVRMMTDATENLKEPPDGAIIQEGPVKIEQFGNKVFYNKAQA